MKLSMAILIFGLILELVEFNETYKIKSYYSPHPPRRPRWHSLPKHRKHHYHPKRISPQKYHLYEQEPDYHRYSSYQEDMSDHEKPYVIVIQLPKNEKKNYYSYQRKHVTDPLQNNDYLDDADGLKVYQLNN
ncbi:PREDICTED: uncharacterized protein LOC105455648 [Wasmannia auropunctata]|uniref:uncharacterized protein LOC105455648 n=1 Tax=Wasmannia auropunctata TaxID=64793 RepID=UPI0005F05F4E|nr:PREDICTED: uncharacterized protein LOC105455648 [Wasmannia auropunctata]XP_011697428.1 PREDICTED: uncharacterized protein LOC105455648 [Wasmannia auropunctata]